MLLVIGAALAPDSLRAQRDADRVAVRPTPLADAATVIAAAPSEVPPELRQPPGLAVESAWTRWQSDHDRKIRSRLRDGDADSLVNLWLYGTSFTNAPRAIDRPGQTDGTGVGPELLARRLDHFLSAVREAADDERMLFARSVFDDLDIEVGTAGGRNRARQYLLDRRRRAQDEFRRYNERFTAAVRKDPDNDIATLATLFRDRGVSLDTSLLPDFATDQALEAIRTQKLLAPGSVHRVAIIGPGLDLVNKADGQDFYPPQTTQPFTLVDSLLRLGLATTPGLSVTAFDISPRVLAHLERAASRAGTAPYIIELRLNENERWTPAYAQFWSQVGERIGEPTTPRPAPATAGRFRQRALRVRPEILRTLSARDLNVVVERTDATAGHRFDLIVATNVLVYYDAFEQALAMANIAAMLEPGGVFLSNNLVEHAPATLSAPLHMELVYSDLQREHVFLYQLRR